MHAFLLFHACLDMSMAWVEADTHSFREASGRAASSHFDEQETGLQRMAGACMRRYVAWVTAAFGPFWGFQEGWWSWLSGVTDNSVYPVLFLSYLDAVFPGAWPVLVLAKNLHESAVHAYWSTGHVLRRLMPLCGRISLCVSWQFSVADNVFPRRGVQSGTSFMSTVPA